MSKRSAQGQAGDFRLRPHKVKVAKAQSKALKQKQNKEKRDRRTDP